MSPDLDRATHLLEAAAWHLARTAQSYGVVATPERFDDVMVSARAAYEELQRFFTVVTEV